MARSSPKKSRASPKKHHHHHKKASPKKRSKSRSPHNALSAWRHAIKEALGVYRVPKKGSADYAKVKRVYMSRRLGGGDLEAPAPEALNLNLNGGGAEGVVAE